LVVHALCSFCFDLGQNALVQEFVLSLEIASTERPLTDLTLMLLHGIIWQLVSLLQIFKIPYE
jgi:hypothetical protein